MRVKTLSALFAVMVFGLGVITATLDANAEEVLSKGSFTGASGHVTSGGVSVVKSDAGTSVVMAASFNFDGAPDPRVGFGKNGKYDPKSQLAHLQSDSGAQSYSVPAGLDTSEYNEVYIWCEKYAVPLGVAKLK